MSTRLRIGCDLSGELPAKAVIRDFRCGRRLLTSYEYDTLPLDECHPEFPKSKHIEVDEIRRFFDRSTEARMTTGADMFAGLKDSDEGLWWSRPADERSVDEVDGVRSYGATTLADESIGMRLRLRRIAEGHDYETTTAYFDNSIMEVSSILWEFSPNGGERNWYQLYDLPNRPFCRITLPEQTTSLRIRAISNNPEEWVQAMAVVPHPDFQCALPSLDPAEKIEGVAIDGFGLMSWRPVRGSIGDVMYRVYLVGGSEPLTFTRGYSVRLEDLEDGARLIVVAEDEVGNTSFSEVVEYYRAVWEEPRPSEPYWYVMGGELRIRAGMYAQSYSPQRGELGLTRAIVEDGVLGPEEKDLPKTE